MGAIGTTLPLLKLIKGNYNMQDCILGYAVIRVYRDSKGDCHATSETSFPSLELARKRASEYRKKLNGNWEVAVASVEMKVKEII